MKRRTPWFSPNSAHEGQDDSPENWADIDRLDLTPRDHRELWGEIPGRELPVLPPELCEQLIMAAAKPELPKLKLPPIKDGNEIYPYPPSLFPKNDIVTHTILLNNHIKTMHDLLKNLDQVDPILDCPPTPEEPKPDVKTSLSGTEESVYNFNLGTGPPYPQLDEKVKQQVLTISVIRILAQLGMDKAKKNVVSVLVDVLIEFLTKATRVCHNLAQNDLYKDHIGFDDVLAHSFQIMGIPNVFAVAEYYQREVVGRRDRQLAKSEHLVNVYNWRASKLRSERESESQVSKKSTNLKNLSETAQGLQPGFQALHLIDSSSTITAQINPIPGPSGMSNFRIAPKKPKK